MNRYKGMVKRIIAVSLMAMMIFAGIAPIEYGAYAEETKYTITWNNWDGSLIKTTEVAEGETPVFDGTTPTRPADSTYVYTFDKWTPDIVPATADATYTATYKSEAALTAPVFKEPVAGFQRVALEWTPSTSKVSGTVCYRVTDLTNNKVVYDGTATKATVDFDPYPGGADGKALYGNKKTSATAKLASYSVYAYVKNTNVRSAASEKRNIEVVHPMYVIVKIKRNCKILKTSSSSKKVGTAKKGQYYVAFGGSRIKGEKKRVIIKVNGENRYISVNDISSFKYVYNSTIGKNYYKGKAGYCYTYAQIENFVTDYDKSKKNNKWSKKDFGIYVDTYHQRAYLLKRTGSGWKVATDYKYHDLLASTGRQLSPYGGYRVANTMAKKKTTGTKWWLLFNHIGIHEKLGEKLGKPASGGCIRVPDPASKWFFDNIKKGTGVLIY